MRIGLEVIPLPTAIRLVSAKFNLPHNPALNLLMRALSEARVAAQGRTKGNLPVQIEPATWKAVLFQDSCPVFAYEMTDINSESLLAWLSSFGAEPSAPARAFIAEPAKLLEPTQPLADDRLSRSDTLQARSGAEAGDAADGDGSLTYSTGAQGRRTSMHLILAEARSRIGSGNVPDSKNKFSKELSDWLKATHAEAAPAQPKTITNNQYFTRLFSEHKASIKTGPKKNPK